MSLKRNAQQNVELSLNELKNVQQQLSDATQTVENPQTKNRIENELNSVNSMISECQNIANTLATDKQPGNK